MKPPVILGAIGGSGTRIVARIVQHADIYMGKNLNESVDAIEFVNFYDSWINRYVESAFYPLTKSETANLREEFLACIERHRAPMKDTDAIWGWKEPRSIYFLPFFNDIYSNMKFIHIIRDGRDMAFSENKNQLLKHGKAVMGEKHHSLPQPVGAAILWNTVNLAAANFSQQHLKDRYLQILFEELCSNPKGTIDREQSIGFFISWEKTTVLRLAQY